MKFVVQTIEGRVVHDFAFHLIEALKFYNWKHEEDASYFTMDYYDIFNLNSYNIIPIGSVEFVTDFLFYFYGVKPVPKNVPDDLFSYAGRNILNGTKNVIRGGDFIKSLKKFKDKNNGLVGEAYGLNRTKIDNQFYQVSEYIDLESEWRAFVYKGRLVGLQNYLGDCTIFPDVKKIRDMIFDYKESGKAPVAYTLDVGIDDKGDTVVIEVHDFFSVGLYGFQDLDLLPVMFSRWFFEFVSGIKKRL